MTGHLCAPGACACDEDAALAEHLAFHHPGQYGPEARRSCPLCEHVCGDRTRAGRCRTCGARALDMEGR